MGSQLVGFAHGKGGLEIGLDDIFRRRQDVRDEVVAELDVGIKRPANLELSNRIEAGRNDSREADGQSNAECNDRR